MIHVVDLKIVLYPTYMRLVYGEYRISHIPCSKQASIPYEQANIPIIIFPKYSISLKVTKILNHKSLKFDWVNVLEHKQSEKLDRF